MRYTKVAGGFFSTRMIQFRSPIRLFCNFNLIGLIPASLQLIAASVCRTFYVITRERVFFFFSCVIFARTHVRAYVIRQNEKKLAFFRGFPEMTIVRRYFHSGYTYTVVAE